MIINKIKYNNLYNKTKLDVNQNGNKQKLY